MIETIGPMGGIVNFTVELQPALVSGDNYTIKRVIDIDPLGVWYNYGSEIISDLTMMESLSVAGAGVEVSGNAMPEDSTNDEDVGSSSKSDSTSDESSINENDDIVEVSNEESENFVSAITSAVIGGGKQLLSGWQLVLTLALISGVAITYMITRTKLKLAGH